MCPTNPVVEDPLLSTREQDGASLSIQPDKQSHLVTDLLRRCWLSMTPQCRQQRKYQHVVCRNCEPNARGSLTHPSPPHPFASFSQSLPDRCCSLSVVSVGVPTAEEACRDIVAVGETGMDALIRARVFLQQSRNADGSLGHLPGQAGHLEPTLLATASRSIAAPLPWLAGQPWGWGKLLLPAVLATEGDAAALVDDTLAQLLALEGERIAEDPAGRVGFDPSLAAWPWVQGTASWVEPTAYALISLKRSGWASHPRVTEGETLLRDRQCVDGGWNYGNPEVLHASLESYLPPTGWATMALPNGPEVARALVRLDAAIEQRSTSTLSLAILARRAHGQAPSDAVVEALVARQRADGSFGGRCDWTALAACALGVVRGEPHPFAVAA